MQEIRKNSFSISHFSSFPSLRNPDLFSEIFSVGFNQIKTRSSSGREHGTLERREVYLECYFSRTSLLSINYFNG